MRRKKPLRARTPLQRRKALRATKALKPGKPLRSRPKPARREVERRAAEAFRRAALSRCKRVKDRYVCPACGKQKPDRLMEAHHVLGRQAIKRHVLGLRLPKDEILPLLTSLLWDKRNALGVCDRCHSRHTTAVERLARTLLDRRHEQFADELGLGHVLDREYR